MKHLDEDKMNIYARKKEDLLSCELSDETNWILSRIDSMCFFTGLLDESLSNEFLRESEALIFKSAGLYEEGYFDCAFYLLREVEDIVIKSILFSEDNSELKKWIKKEDGFTLLEIKRRLSIVSDNYKQITEKLGGFIGEVKQARKKAHKFVHKQGVDTFYTWRRFPSNYIAEKKKEEQGFYEEYLKRTVGLMLIVYMAIDPLSLALSDKNLCMKIHEDYITGPIDVELVKKCIGVKNFNNIKKLDIHKDAYNYYASREEVSVATMNVTKAYRFHMDELDDIWKDKQKICTFAFQFLRILRRGLKISRLFSRDLTYWHTSIESTNVVCGLPAYEYERHFSEVEKYNLVHEKAFVSRIWIISEYCLLEHNEVLSDEEISFLEEISSEDQIKLFEEQNDRKLTQEEINLLEEITAMCVKEYEDKKRS